jgi:hypothetical protein
MAASCPGGPDADHRRFWPGWQDRRRWLTPSDWGLIGACSLAPVAVVELVKLLRR